MGMTKASLDFQIQQETQKAIATLQKNIEQINGMMRVIDGNMRQSHMVLYQDVTQLRIRVNFLLDELKNSVPEDKQKEIEEKFMAFAKNASEQMQKDIADSIAARQKAEEEKKNAQTEPKLVQ